MYLKIFRNLRNIWSKHTLKTDPATHIASYLQNIVNNLPHFLVWKDVNSVFLGCNKMFADSIGLKSPRDIVGMTDYDCPWTVEQRESYLADEREIIRTGKAKLNYEETQTQPDGSIKTMLVNKVPMYDEKRKICGILIIFSDITERKHLEENLKKAQEDAERANKAKLEFIRNISHDIRTPLAGIQQIFHAFSQGKIAEEAIPELSFSGWESSAKLMELFNQIIEISKKEYFDFEDEIVKFDLHKLLQELEKTYTVVAKHKGLQLNIEYAEATPRYLLGQHLRLHRILMNLLGNALKFTKKGNVTLHVEKAKEKNNEVILRFSVTDTGIGIAKENLSRIFELFSRLNPSFENQYPGSGLGLHVVKDYINKIQGEIYVDSKEGAGSNFTCIIPFKRPLLDNDHDVVKTEYAQNFNTINPPQEKTSNIPSTTNQVTDSKYQVLLVEDDPIAQTMGILYLKDKNYKIDLAASGKEALELTSKTPYDLIYMDLGLGDGIDGIETTRRIRTDKQNLSQKAFITALTAHGNGDKEIVQKCIDAGMQTILSKPLSPEKVLEIQSLLEKSGNIQKIQLVIDFDLWRSRIGTAVIMLDTLVHTIGQEFGIYKNTIKEIYEAHDLSRLKATTHKLKGALSYSGFPRLEKAIIAIEAAAKQNNTAEVDKWYPETMDALNEAQIAYENWAKDHPLS